MRPVPAFTTAAFLVFSAPAIAADGAFAGLSGHVVKGPVSFTRADGKITVTLDAGFSLGSGTLLGVGENPYLRPLRARDRKTGLSSFDWSVGAVCTRLGMAMRPWDEVRCHHAEGAAEDGTYAMTHPASGGSARFLVEPGGVCGGL